jgi:hypothetical protein
LIPLLTHLDFRRTVPLNFALLPSRFRSNAAMKKRHGKVAWRCIYLTHDTCFSLCRVDLDSGTGFPVCCRKRRKDRVFALCFFRAQLFRFYTRSFIFVPHAFFLRLASAIARKKRGRPPLHIIQIYSHAHIRQIMK